jgi:hypothetical protein
VRPLWVFTVVWLVLALVFGGLILAESVSIGMPMYQPASPA